MKLLIKTLLVATTLTVGAWTVHAADDAKALFDRHCASCHGKDGKGDTRMGKKLGVKDYSTAKGQAEFTDAEAVKAIKEGVKKDGKQEMKPFDSKLNDQQIKDLVAYVRTLKGK